MLFGVKLVAVAAGLGSSRSGRTAAEVAGEQQQR